MKKKIISLFLAAVMACSVCACGGNAGAKYEKYDTLLGYLESENYEQAYRELERIEKRGQTAKDTENAETKEENPDEAAIDVAKLKRDEDGNLHISEKQFAACLEKIVLTADNWSQYFGDYQYTDHREEVNSFGEVENEYDYTYYVFGLKPEYMGAVKGVAFKFTGGKYMSEEIAWNNDTQEATPGYVEILPGADHFKIYDRNGNQLEGEWNLNNFGYNEPIKDSLVADLGDSVWTHNIYYTDYECTAVTGEIILVHLPEELLQEIEGDEYLCVDMQGGGG